MKNSASRPSDPGPVFIELRYGHKCSTCGRRCRRGAAAWWTPPSRDGGPVCTGFVTCRKCHAATNAGGSTNV